MGSKYEIFVFPIISIAMGASFVGIGKFESKKKEFGNENVMAISTLTTLGLFNAITAYVLYRSFTYSEALASQAGTEMSFRFILIPIGIAFCILGNYMPKTRRNSFIGLRTVWSMKNETTWMKSQRFGGISLAICGIFIVVTNLFITSYWGFVFSMVLIALATILSILATYVFYKQSE